MSQKSLKTLSLLLGLLVTPSLSLVAADDPYLFKSDDSTVEDLLNKPEYSSDKFKEKFISLTKLCPLPEHIKISASITRNNSITIRIHSGSSPSYNYDCNSKFLAPCLLHALVLIAIKHADPIDWITAFRNDMLDKAIAVAKSESATKHLMSAAQVLISVNDIVNQTQAASKNNHGVYINPLTNKEGVIDARDISCSEDTLLSVNSKVLEVNSFYALNSSGSLRVLSAGSTLADAKTKINEITTLLNLIKFDGVQAVHPLASIENPEDDVSVTMTDLLDPFLNEHKLNVVWDFDFNSLSESTKKCCFQFSNCSFKSMTSTTGIWLTPLLQNDRTCVLSFGNNIFENSGVEDFYIPPFSCKVAPKVFGGSHVNQLFIPQGYQGSFAELNTWCSSMADKDFDATKPINKENEPKKDNNYGSGNVSVLVDHADFFPRILIKKNEEIKETPQTGSGTTPATPPQQEGVVLTKDIVSDAFNYRSDGKTSVSRCTPVTIIVDESITSIEEDAFAPLKDFIVGRMVLTPSASLCQSLKTTSTSIFDHNNSQSIKVNQLILRGPNVQSFIEKKLNNVFSGAHFTRVNIVAAMKSFDQPSLKFLENTGVEQLYLDGPVGSIGERSVEELKGLKRLHFDPMGEHVNWDNPLEPKFDAAYVYHFNPLYRLDKKQPAFIRKNFDWKKAYSTNSVAYAAKWPDVPFSNSTLEYVNIPYYVTGFKDNWYSGCQNLKEVECYRFKGNNRYNWGTLSKKVMSFFSNVPTGCTINFASGHMTKVEKSCLDGLSQELRNSIKIKISLNHAQFKKDGLTKDILPLPNIVGVGLPWNYPYKLKEDLFESCNNGQIYKDFELWMSDYCNIPATSISDVFAKTTGLNSWFINFSDGRYLQFDKHGEEPTPPTE